MLSPNLISLSSFLVPYDYGIPGLDKASNKALKTRFTQLASITNKKIRTWTIAAALTLIVISTIGQTVHAQTSESFRFNNSAYVPGDSGTVTYYITNTQGQTITLKNLTFFFPWAGS